MMTKNDLQAVISKWSEPNDCLQGVEKGNSQNKFILTKPKFTHGTVPPLEYLMVSHVEKYCLKSHYPDNLEREPKGYPNADWNSKRWGQVGMFCTVFERRVET